MLPCTAAPGLLRLRGPAGKGSSELISGERVSRVDDEAKGPGG